MRLSAFVHAFTLSSVGVALMACSSSGGGSPAGGGGTESGAPAVTFTDVYTQIISVKCTLCHVPGEVGVTEGMLDMSTQSTAYGNLVGAATAGIECAGSGTRVVAGDPASSILYQKITSPTCGSRMPLNSAALDQSSIDEIHSWIEAGAPGPQ
jgi:hypothetical protein